MFVLSLWGFQDEVSIENLTMLFSSQKGVAIGIWAMDYLL